MASVPEISLRSIENIFLDFDLIGAKNGYSWSSRGISECAKDRETLDGRTRVYQGSKNYNFAVKQGESE